MRRGMRTGQSLFLLIIEPDIPWIRPWKEFLATGVQSTWPGSGLSKPGLAWPIPNPTRHTI
ncbi:hypothetical protein MTR_2g034120 [Medicago truncatula]|uniref:Uncharacterized protein n=1 Tax=Medicago truncatula TaxID=3880 RepID=G7IFX0_MEDTR|nr:hypothetical protein MTR_2g034120 [Medicago truncatula]